MSRRDSEAEAGGGRRRSVFAGLASAILTLFGIAVLIGAAVFWAYAAPGPKTADRSGRTVVLRKGAGLPEIGATLENGHVVASAPLFMAIAQVTGSARRLKPGEYLFNSGASLASVLKKIRAGDVVHHRVTVPEGRTSQQAVAILNANPVLVGDVAAPPKARSCPRPMTWCAASSARPCCSA